MMTECMQQRLAVFKTVKLSSVLTVIRCCINNTAAVRTADTTCLQIKTLVHVLFLVNRERAIVITLGLG